MPQNLGSNPTQNKSIITKDYVDSVANVRAVTVVWNGVAPQPARPVTSANVPCDWRCPVQPAGGGTVSGGAGAVDGLDFWFKTS